MTIAKSTTTRTRTSKKKEVMSEAGLVQGEVLGITEEKPLSTTGDTVTVCFNYPHNIKFMIPDNRGRKRPIIINGNAVNLKGKASGIIPIGAYGVTLGVPREAWEYIKTAYQDAPYIQNGLMFATEASNAKMAVAERTDLRHGYEPASPVGNSEPMQ